MDLTDGSTFLKNLCILDYLDVLFLEFNRILSPTLGEEGANQYLIQKKFNNKISNCDSNWKLIGILYWEHTEKMRNRNCFSGMEFQK